MLFRSSDAGLIFAAADQPAFGSCAQRQPQRIEQDRFARARLTRQHTEPARKIEIERFDQHHVADGEAGQHVRRLF